MSRYFDNFPELTYTFESGITVYVKDIFKKVGISQKNFNNVISYEKYNIKEGERPDVVAAKLYKNADLYWTFYLVNDFDNFDDWFKDTQEFEKHLDKVYKGKWLVAPTSSDVVSYNFTSNPPKSEKFVLGEKVTSGSKSGTVLKVDPTYNRILVETNSTFNASETITGAVSSKSFTTTSVQDARDGVCYYENDNGLRTNVPTAGFTSVTFYEKEVNENEEKRSIKIINPSLMGRVIDEFERLV